MEDEDEEDDDADNQYNGTEDDPPSTGGDSLSEEEEESILKKQPKRSRSEEPQESPEDLDPTLQKTRVADKLKGQAVSRQLVKLFFLHRHLSEMFDSEYGMH